MCKKKSRSDAGVIFFCFFEGKYFFDISFNSLPKDKILDQSKFKAFADDRINVTKKLKFVS